MRISVLIPLYNKREHIARAVLSVLDQSENFDELIVVDDGSTDGSSEIVEAFGDSVRLVRQPNRGEAAARNRGLDEARGTHIAFLDADDCWLPNFLKVVCDLVRRHPEAAIYGTGYEFIEPDGLTQCGVSGVGRFLKPGDRLDYFAALASWNFPLTSSSVCVPASMFHQVGRFNERLSIGADIDMWSRLCIAGPAFFSNQLCARYHRDAENRSNIQPAFWDKRLRFLASIGECLVRDAVSGPDRQNLRRFLARATYETLVGKANTDSSFDLARAVKEYGSILGYKYILRFWARKLRRSLS